MTREDQVDFVRDLTDTVRTRIVKRIAEGDVPEHWDGLELRRYIADCFEEATLDLRRGVVRYRGQTKRLRAYRNDVLINGL